MPKLQDYREAFYTFSGKASDLSRQLSFAGIALIWLFKQDRAGQPVIPPELILPSIFIVGSLALDMVHYVTASGIWYLFYRSKENANVKESTELKHSPWLDGTIMVLFAAKLMCVILAYLWILEFLILTFRLA